MSQGFYSFGLYVSPGFLTLTYAQKDALDYIYLSSKISCVCSAGWMKITKSPRELVCPEALCILIIWISVKRTAWLQWMLQALARYVEHFRIRFFKKSHFSDIWIYFMVLFVITDTPSTLHKVHKASLFEELPRRAKQKQRISNLKTTCFETKMYINVYNVPSHIGRLGQPNWKRWNLKCQTQWPLFFIL